MDAHPAAPGFDRRSGVVLPDFTGGILHAAETGDDGLLVPAVFHTIQDKFVVVIQDPLLLGGGKARDPGPQLLKEFIICPEDSKSFPVELEGAGV